MPIVERIMRVAPPPDAVWERICDYRTAMAWDPRIAAVEKIRGSGGFGTEYRATMPGLLPEADIRFKVVQWRPMEGLQLRGTHPQLRLLETLLLRRGLNETYVHWMSELFPDEGGPPLPQLSGQELHELGDHVVASLVAFLEQPETGAAGALLEGATRPRN